MLFNRARAEAYMRACDLDVLIVTAPVSITYFTDYACWIDPLMKEYMMSPGASAHIGQAFAVYPQDGAPAFICSGALMAVNAIDLWVKDVRCYGASGADFSLPASELPPGEQRIYDLLTAAPSYATPAEALTAVITDRGLTSARIGFESDGVPVERYEAVCQLLPRADIRNCSNLIRLIRAVKTQDEIDMLARAAEISEVAAMEAFTLAANGKSIRPCIDHFRTRISEMGAEMDHFAYGYHGMGIATEPDRILKEDFVEYVDWGCVYGKCYSDTGTTLALRPLSNEMQRRFDALRACMDASAAAIRPGAKASEVRTPMLEVMTQHGLTDTFPHGHGLGLEVRGYPIIVPENGLRIRDDCIDVSSDLPLEKDMVVNLEAPLFMPGVGSLHIEESFLVTTDGSIPLVAQERRMPVIPG